MALLTWVIIAYERHHHGVLRYLRHMIYRVSAFVMLLLDASCFAYIQAEVPGGPPAAVVVLIFAVTALFYMTAVPLGQRIIAPLIVWVTSMGASVDCGSPTAATSIPRGRRSPIDRCAWTALGYLTAAGIADVIVGIISGTAWDRPVVPVAYAVAGTSLLLPLGLVVLALRAMAPDEAARGGTERQPPASLGRRRGLMLPTNAYHDLPREWFETYMAVDHSGRRSKADINPAAASRPPRLPRVSTSNRQAPAERSRTGTGWPG